MDPQAGFYTRIITVTCLIYVFTLTRGFGWMILSLLITNLTRACVCVCVLSFCCSIIVFFKDLFAAHTLREPNIYSTWNILATTEVLSLVVYFEVLQREKSMKVLSHQNKARLLSC